MAERASRARGSVPSVEDSTYEHAQNELARLTEWWESQPKGDRNEATTRLHLIDELLRGPLAWPREQVVAEESYGGSYADYSLGIPATRLIVEAKRESIGFELPAGVGPGVVSITTLFDLGGDVEKAIRQVLGYCQERGVPFAAVSNGVQWVGFIASRDDAVPPLRGRAIVFDSLNAMAEQFLLFWNNFSMAGVDARGMRSTLDDAALAPPPEKLSARVADYPGFWIRNRIQNELKILGDLVLQDIADAPQLEEEFLRQCYSSSDTLSEYAVVSREILEARYSAFTDIEAEASTTPARRKGEVARELTHDVLASSLGRRPLILLGDVGVGKSTFIRHFRRIDAAEVMDKSIVLSINFGGEPALTADLNDYVMDHFVDQLRDDGIDVSSDKFVRNVYKNELKSFERGVYGRLRKTDAAQYELKEIQLLERKLDARDRHLQASLSHASRAMGRQIVVFLDNIDQRDFEFQEKVFLIGQSLAETWPATVFLSLRPETFYRSRNVGSLTAYQPRVFTIAPPEIATVIVKRVRFCKGLLGTASGAWGTIPEGLSEQATTLGVYLDVLEHSFQNQLEIVELVENLSSGNVRAALGFVNTFVGSGHVDTRKILDIQEKQGDYLVAFHEFVRAIIYGDTQYFDPGRSPVANVFEISSPDGKEHFLLPIVLAHVERAGGVSQSEGFVKADDVITACQTLGFLPSQIEFALSHAENKRLLQRNPGARENARRYRITTVGAYTCKKLIRRFVYLDAVVVDTPIVDADAAEGIRDCSTIEERLERAERFVGYLDSQWKPLENRDTAFSWSDARAAIAEELVRVSRSAQRHRERPRTRSKRPTAKRTPSKRSSRQGARPKRKAPPRADDSNSGAG